MDPIYKENAGSETPRKGVLRRREYNSVMLLRSQIRLRPRKCPLDLSVGTLCKYHFSGVLGIEVSDSRLRNLRVLRKR